MKTWTQEALTGMCGSHISSDQCARIQVLSVASNKKPLWNLGDCCLLLICLSGYLVVETDAGDFRGTLS